MNKKKNMAIDFQDNMILLTRKYLKRKIMCPETKFRHHVKERLHMLELLKRTVDMGESNSALLIGPRGCGKTTVCLIYQFNLRFFPLCILYNIFL